MFRCWITSMLGGALAVLCCAQPVVKVTGTTSTQAVLSYEAPDAAACTVVVSEQPGLSPLVYDVDPALFANADKDLSRSTTVLNGQYRTLTIGARTSEKALNGWLYSRALQVFTPHYYTVACSTGTATGVFVTANIPLGNTFPEPPPFNANGFGNYGWPTIDWTDATKTYIDPMTGVLMKIAHQPPGIQSNSQYGGPTEYAFANFLDANSAWTSASNVLNKSTSGPFTSYTGPSSAPLFISVNPFGQAADSWSPGYGATLDDLRLTLYGYGDNATAADRTILACLSIDSQTCASSEIEVVLPPTTVGTVAGPATYPKIQFSGWGVGRFLQRNEISTNHGTVNVNGTTVTAANTDYAINKFDVNWSAGSKIYIQDSSSACMNSLCTIASVQNARNLTIVENAGTLTGKNFQSAAWGVRLRKKTATGTVYLNSSYAYAYSYAPTMPLNGNADFCSKQTTTVSYAADGVTPITPVQGRLCVLQLGYQNPSMLVLLIESTGETRVLSDFYHNSGLQSVTFSSFDPTDPLTLYNDAGDDTGGYPRHALFKIQYDAASGKFKTWAGTNYNYSARVDDHLIYTNLTPYSSHRTISEQVAAAITANPFYQSSMGSTPAYAGIVGGYAIYSLGFGGLQNSPCFAIMFDMTTGNLAKIADTMGGFSPTGRWAGCHAVQAFGADGWIMVSASLLMSQNASSYMGGPFVVRQISAVYRDGIWDSNTALTPAYAYSCVAKSGSDCLRIRVTGEPCSAYATAAEKALYPCPWDANQSAPQTLQVGDYIASIETGPYEFTEKMLVLSKTSIGGGAFELEVQRKASCSGYTYSDFSLTHANGWGAMMNGTSLCAGNGWWLNASGTTWVPDNNWLASGHATLGSGESAGEYSYIVAGTLSRFSQTMASQIAQPATYSQTGQSTSSFNGSSRSSGEDVQSYPNKGQWTAPVSEQVWALDLRHYNPSNGIGSEWGAGIWPQNYSLVAGTAQVYKIDNAGVYGKTLPYLAWAGRYLLKDKSGPGSSITDADSWRFCVAYKTGECRPGSNVNDTFVSVPHAGISTSCVVNQYSENYPCFTNGYWFGGWATQTDVSRNDPLGLNGRRLTMAFTGPGRQYEFKNFHTTPSGRWAFVESGWLDGVRDDMLLVKLPAWPNTAQDGTRSGFVPIQVDLGPSTQYSKARIHFGYAENGPVTNFFCTSRQEACVTDTLLTPFAYENSDALAPMSCQGGCSISIPAIPGRVLYYQVERLNDRTSDVLKQGPVAQVVP